MTIIGGYLGAGKTTLVNALLAADHGRRLAVVVNDFGDINIDANLIVAHEGSTVSLSNGCVCCSISDSLGAALDTVVALDPPPDQIVIEASGVADPAKIAAYGQGWPGCRLDAVIVLADAETIRSRADDQFVGELVTRQLAGGDIVFVTKTDLVDDAAAAQVCDWVRRTTDNRTPVAPCVRGDVPVGAVLDLDAQNLRTAPTGDHRSPDKTEMFVTTTLSFAQAVPRGQLEDLLQNLPDEVVRVKGILALDDGVRCEVHRVGRRWSITPTSAELPITGEVNHAGVLALIGLTGALDDLMGSDPLFSP